MDRILQMFLNRLIGRVMNMAINKGINFAANRGKDPAEMTEEEHASARIGRETAQKARKISRASRKLF
jgi:hypothetical protein